MAKVLISVIIRVPEELKEWLEIKAEREFRSLNKTVVAILSKAHQEETHYQGRAHAHADTLTP